MSAGCSSFRSEIKGSYELPPAKNYGAEKVSVLFIFSHASQTKGYDAVPKLERNISGFDDIFNDALNEIRRKFMSHSCMIFSKRVKLKKSS